MSKPGSRPKGGESKSWKDADKLGHGHLSSLCSDSPQAGPRKRPLGATPVRRDGLPIPPWRDKVRSKNTLIRLDRIRTFGNCSNTANLTESVQKNRPQLW